MDVAPPVSRLTCCSDGGRPLGVSEGLEVWRRWRSMGPDFYQGPTCNRFFRSKETQLFIFEGIVYNYIHVFFVFKVKTVLKILLSLLEK